MKNAMIISLLGLFTLSASAQDRQDLMSRQKMRDATITISVSENNADRNQDRRILLLEKAVRDLQYRVYDLEDMVMRNVKPIPAGDDLDKCELSGPGMAGNTYWPIVVMINGKPSAGANSLADALKSVRSYQEAQLCSMNVGEAKCELAGAGLAGNTFWPFTVAVNGANRKIVAGANNEADAINAIKSIRQANLCR